MEPLIGRIGSLVYWYDGDRLVIVIEPSKKLYLRTGDENWTKTGENK